MTKQRAWNILNEYLETNNPPKEDCIVYREHTEQGINDYTFLGLIAICYEVKPIAIISNEGFFKTCHRKWGWDSKGTSLNPNGITNDKRRG